MPIDRNVWPWRREVICPVCGNLIKVISDYCVGSPKSTQEQANEPCESCLAAEPEEDIEQTE
jgi:hypothetical protein